MVSILDYGARGDGVSNDAPAIQRAIDVCASAGGGTVRVPAGKTYLAGSFALKSHVHLQVESGAVIRASVAREDYHRHRCGEPCWITADGAQCLQLSGGGVIDGCGTQFMREERPYIFAADTWRPRMFLLENCHRVTIRDLTISNGPQWTLHLAGCDDVVISGVRIFNHLKVPNSDAIDLDCCKNVRISDCHIEAGDDCICLKTCPEFAERYGACENVLVTGCTLVSTSAALVIGCEAKAVMRNVIFDACVVRASHRGLAIHLSHEADVENVIFSNCIVETRIFHDAWWGAGEPIYVVAIPWSEHDRVGAIRHVRFSNILCRSEQGVYVHGWAPDRIEDICFDHVRVEIAKWSKWPPRHDVRPLPGYGPDSLTHGVSAQPVHGFFLRNARRVSLRHCEVVWSGAPQPFWQSALEQHGVEDLQAEHFAGPAVPPATRPLAETGR